MNKQVKQILKRFDEATERNEKEATRKEAQEQNQLEQHLEDNGSSQPIG